MSDDRDRGLAALLELLFDAPALELFLKQYYSAVARELGGETSLAARSFNTVLLLKQHGQIDLGLFSNLIERRPGQREAIRLQALRWPGVPPDFAAPPRPRTPPQLVHRPSRPGPTTEPGATTARLVLQLAALVAAGLVLWALTRPSTTPSRIPTADPEPEVVQPAKTGPGTRPEADPPAPKNPQIITADDIIKAEDDPTKKTDATKTDSTRITTKVPVECILDPSMCKTLSREAFDQGIARAKAAARSVCMRMSGPASVTIKLAIDGPAGIVRSAIEADRPTKRGECAAGQLKQAKFHRTQSPLQHFTVTVAF